mgnify:CR=1 FL=1
MKNILITGGSGLIGKKTTSLLEVKGYSVAWLSRYPNKTKQLAFAWDVDQGFLDPKALEWADAVIHLAGEGVADKRWTEERKKAILESRTNSAQLLSKGIETASKKPSSFVSASAVGFYGFDTNEHMVDESSPSATDFLSQVVVAWENGVDKIASLGIRTVKLRIGIVLDRQGGALKEMMKPPVSAPLGNGRQWMSWIHSQDLARMFVYALENPLLAGTYNAVAPNPSRNAELTKVAARFARKPYLGIGVPGLALKLVLGEMAQMVLGGNKVSSKKIQDAGFEFKYPELEAALREVYGK